MKLFPRSVFAAALCAAMAPGFAATASADGAGTTAPSQTSAPLTDPQIRSSLEKQGYTDIQAITHSGDQVNVVATKEGRTGNLTVDPRTGQVVGAREGEGGDDDDDD